MHSRKVTRLARAGLLAVVLSGTAVEHAWADGTENNPPPVVVTPGQGLGGVLIGVHAPGSSGAPAGNGAGGAYQGGSSVNSNPFFSVNLPVGAKDWGACPAAGLAFCGGAPPPPAPGAPAPAAPPPPSAVALAVSAWGQLQMPSPAPSRYPSGTLKESGHPYTIVNANTWFWTDPATWQPVSKTVTAGAVWGAATATPVRLNFTPGDGSRTVSCPGPGRSWKANEQTWLAPVNAQGCSYRYPNSSLGVGGDDQVTAMYTITWNVTWSGSDGTSGTFNNMQTSTTSRFGVAEVQTVVVN